MNEKFLWVEKYAPTTIDECILPEGLKREFSQMDTIPNMLLIGNAGVGKTTVAKVLCESLGVDMMFMNASTERGLDDVRIKIQSFASTTSMFGDYKVLLLDEADNLTQDAQKALRAMIEQYQNNCRFVLTCNYPHKLIEPLRGRLQEYVFTYPSDGKALQNEFVKRTLDILTTENVKVTKTDVPVLISLSELYYPNWRKAVWNLQRISASGSIDSSIVAKVKEEHISSLFELMKAKNFTKVRHWIAEHLSQGVSETEVINIIYREMDKFMKPPSMPECILILGEYQHKATLAANQEINCVAMCTEMMMRCEWL